MIVHRDRFLVNKPNRRTEFQFYWYYDSTCFGQSFCPSSGASQPYNGIGTIYAATMIRTERPDHGGTRSPSCINCTNAVVRLRSSWWWAERLPERCRIVIPIKLERSTSVGFIQKEWFCIVFRGSPRLWRNAGFCNAVGQTDFLYNNAHVYLCNITHLYLFNQCLLILRLAQHYRWLHVHLFLVQNIPLCLKHNIKMQ
jgi:hypothetical protein